MLNFYIYKVINPNFDDLGYVKAVANLKEKRDRSAPTNYHWKILKCRMIIFSSSSILSCPDKSDVKQIHLIFNKKGDHYDRLTALFSKYSVTQDGGILEVTPEIYSMCFLYTMTAKIAPLWNSLGSNFFINNRDFLQVVGPQNGIQYKISATVNTTTLELKPVKIHLLKSKEKYIPGDQITVMPSLNKAVIEEYCESLPTSGDFKSYKDIRRHWKNIHGYRLPEQEPSYYTVRFWRGEPLTYPEICLLRGYPIVTTVPKSAENVILTKFINSLKIKMPYILGVSLSIVNESCDREDNFEYLNNGIFSKTQTLSLCTPTQNEME